MQDINKKITRQNAIEYINAAVEQKQYDRAFDLLKRFKKKGFTITLSKLKQEYSLSKTQMEELVFTEVKNPHYSIAAPMKLYLIGQIEHVLNQ